ncbi:His-Xaa-Ser system protein HxsD [Epilithonimonas hominis]|uniref:His-Xaa-Ser system protein HxsD n=1 Tax=Epilithonimonas hominis TaxID=420404 RepID=UPI0028970A65|nr:His-Xaa-Ser system protein HxsD [Epilithonimonas hominis]
MEYTFKDNIVSIYLNQNFYSVDAIFKCIYWYGDKYNVILDTNSDLPNKIQVKFHSKDNSKPIKDVDIEKIINDFINKINDFQLRDIITKETKNIRDLLVAKAFSNGEFDEEPPGEFADFLGQSN